MAEPAQFAALLTALSQPNTDTIRQAEAQLKPLLKVPANMMPLWAVVSDTNQPEAVRHVGAILLRKRLPGHYQNDYNKELQAQWQHHVLNLLSQEKSRPVRAGLVGVAAALAQVEQTATEPYLQFLSAAANSTLPDARELCFLLLQEMTETIGMHWKEHLNNLLQLFGTVLHSQTEATPVHKAAVKAIGQLMSFWTDEPEIESLAPLLPVLLTVASRHWNDEDFLGTILEVLYDLSYSPHPALAQHMEVTVQFALQCLRNRDLELRVRDSAALVIATVAEYKPKRLGRNTNLMAALLDTLFQMMQDAKESAAGALFESNPTWKQDLIEEGHEDLDDDDDGITESSMAQGTLDILACEIPKKYVWEPALRRCMERMHSSDANARKAGVAGLGVIAEGCCEPLTMSLAQVLPLALRAAQDPAASVRECACFCLGQISEHCQPDILRYNKEILPVIFQLLDDQSVAVQATSCYVLEMFCERLEPHAVRHLLDSLVRKLAGMLEATNKRSVQEMAVAALAATAVAAEEEFAPYVTGVADIMSKLMMLTDPLHYSLRGRALECMGHMAIAVGRDIFRPYFTATMQSAMHGLTVDSTELQEFAYAVFANLSKVMKEDFSPALPDLVPHLIQVIDMDEGQVEQATPNDEGGYAALDDSDDEDEDGNYVFHVRTALVEVKKGAITALGEMAAHCGASFCPYLENSMQVLQKSSSNWHPIIKCEAADAFPSMIVPSIAAYHNGEIQWTKGDLQNVTYLSQHTAALVHAVLNEELALMDDEDKAVVGKACEAVQSVIELCGPQALSSVLQGVIGKTLALLRREAPCQAADDWYSEGPDDDDDEHDAFMQAVCDLVGAMAGVMGEHFGQCLNEFLPAICEYAKTSRPPSDRAMAVGCLSEICEELGQATAPHWKNVFLPVILQLLADEDHSVKRNAAYCAGTACENLKEFAAADYPALLQGLGPLFSLDTNSDVDAVQACVDNSAAAVARMIMAQPHQVPLAEVLPVFFRVLPLKSDMSENPTIYKCVIGIMQHPEAAKLKPEIVRIFREATSANSRVDDETKQKIQQAMSTM